MKSKEEDAEDAGEGREEDQMETDENEREKGAASEGVSSHRSSSISSSSSDSEDSGERDKQKDREPTEDDDPNALSDDEPAPSVEESRKALRGRWEVAAVLHFTRLFGATLKLRTFGADQLETALLRPEDCSAFVGELVFK